MQIKSYLIIFITLTLSYISINVVNAESLPSEWYKLSKNQKKIAYNIMSTEYMYSCCDTTILKCIESKKDCKLITHLIRHICILLLEGNDESEIKRSLSKRAMTILGRDYSSKIDLKDLPVAGDRNSPVTVVIYACLRCAYCSKIIPPLYDSITNGNLKGKAKLIYKPFVIKGHLGAKQAEKSVIAANMQNRAWEYIIYAYHDFSTEYKDGMYFQYASDLKLNFNKFVNTVNDNKITNYLIKYKKEGLILNVQSTPTIFINGKQYITSLSYDIIEDVILEEYYRKIGKM